MREEYEYDMIQEIACSMDAMESGFFLGGVAEGKITEEEVIHEYLL